MRKCSADVVWCDYGEACLGSSDLGVGSQGGGGGALEEMWVCLPGGDALTTDPLVPREIGEVCNYSLECVRGGVCVCVPPICTGGGETGRTCQLICDPTLINGCPSVGNVRPECTDLGTGRGFCDPSSLVEN